MHGDLYTTGISTKECDVYSAWWTGSQCILFTTNQIYYLIHSLCNHTQNINYRVSSLSGFNLRSCMWVFKQLLCLNTSKRQSLHSWYRNENRWMPPNLSTICTVYRMLKLDFVNTCTPSRHTAIKTKHECLQGLFAECGCTLNQASWCQGELRLYYTHAHIFAMITWPNSVLCGWCEWCGWALLNKLTF